MPEFVVLTEQLLADVPGGTGRYTAQLATALARTAPDGWTVTGVLARHANVAAAELPGVAGPRRLALPRRALTAAWRSGLGPWPGGDAVHAPTPLAPPRRRGASLTVAVHDTVPWTHPETLTARGAAWHRAAIAAALRRADAITVPTGAVAADLAARVSGPAPVRVIGHGVSAPGARRAVPGLPAQYVLALGTVEPRKGLDTLVEAMAGAVAPPVPLVIAGPTGWGGIDPVALADAHGLDRARLLVLGRLTDAEVAAVLGDATVLAVPSLAEGFGLGLLEAMAAGVPVVHSDAPALVEVAAGAGIVVPTRDAAALADALRRVVAEPGMRAELVAAGHRRAAGFTWDAAARELWRLHLSAVRR